MVCASSGASHPTESETAHPERIIPAETTPGIVALHLKRYQFARKYIIGKHVLDVACGVGYGSLHLADVCRQVVGADIDWVAGGLRVAAQQRQPIEVRIFGNVCHRHLSKVSVPPLALYREC